MASLMRCMSRLGPRVLMATRNKPSVKSVLSLPSTGRFIQPVCFISTSDKNKDAVTLGDKSHHGPPAKPEVLENLEEKEENWISYGYDLVDRDIDEWTHHLIMFCTITITMCFGGLFLAYFPDFKHNAWAQREAYLELARREREGLPLISADLIDASKINLPSEEELGDFEIII